MLAEVRSTGAGSRPVVRRSRPVLLRPVLLRPVLLRLVLTWTWPLRTRRAAVLLAWPWPAGTAPTRAARAGSALARPVLLLAALARAAGRLAGTVRTPLAGLRRPVLRGRPACAATAAARSGRLVTVEAAARSRATRGSGTSPGGNRRFVRDEIGICHAGADTICTRLPRAAAGWPWPRTAGARRRVF